MCAKITKKILNIAKKDDSYNLGIPDKKFVEEPIILQIPIQKTNKRTEMFIVIGKGSSVTFFEEFIPENTPNFRVKLLIDENAAVEYYAPQNSKKKFVIERKATVKKNARITWYDINLDNAEGVSKIETLLDEAGAESHTYGLFIGKKEKKLDISHITIHNAPNTASKMESKIILDDSAEADYKGLISIPHKYPNCKGEERTNVLLLSPKAHIETLPELDVGNNKVKCTHAVTISRMDKEKMFYLNSRGVDEREAEKLLTNAFLAPIVDTIKNDTIRRIILSS